MLRVSQANQNTKFNVKLDLPELNIGKNREPHFKKLFAPQYIPRDLEHTFDITRFNIASAHHKLILRAAEEVRSQEADQRDQGHENELCVRHAEPVACVFEGFERSV